MAKGDREKVNRAIKQERDTLNQQYGSFLDTVNQNQAWDVNQARRQSEFATQGYETIFNRGGIDPTVAANLRALNRRQSSVYGGDYVGGEGYSPTDRSSVALPPPDPFAASRAAFADFIASGGVDIGAMKEALGGYRKIAESGGFAPEEKAEIQTLARRLADLGATGGYTPEEKNRVLQNINVLSQIGQTGGFSPEALGILRPGLQEFAATGGISGEALNRLRGAGVLDEFATTGGYSPQMIQNLRARATSVIPALYERDVQELQRSNALLGAAAPNYGAALARLARNRGMALADAAREAELGINEQVLANRLRGATALSSAEAAAQNLITRNRLAGLSGIGELENALVANRLAGAAQAATQLQNLQQAINQAKLQGNVAAAQQLQNLADTIARNQLAALGGITTTQQGAEEIAQRGRIAGAQGMFGVESAAEQARLQAEAIAAQERAAAEAAAAQERAMRAADEQFWASLAAANEQYIGTTGLGGELSALGGLQSLYATAPGAVGQNYQAALNAMANRGQLALGGLELQHRNIGPGILDTIGKGLGLAGSVAGAFLGIPKAPIPAKPLPGGGMTTLAPVIKPQVPWR